MSNIKFSEVLIGQRFVCGGAGFTKIEDNLARADDRRVAQYLAPDTIVHKVGELAFKKAAPSVELVALRTAVQLMRDHDKQLAVLMAIANAEKTTSESYTSLRNAVMMLDAMADGTIDITQDDADEVLATLRLIGGK